MNTKAALWTGRVLSGLVILFLTVDGAIKLGPIQAVTDSLRELGYPTSDSFARFLGVVTLVGTALYAWPRTSLLGAVLLTGLMGGAIATHLRLDHPLFSHTLFGVYLGLFLWGGLWCGTSVCASSCRSIRRSNPSKPERGPPGPLMLFVFAGRARHSLARLFLNNA